MDAIRVRQNKIYDLLEKDGVEKAIIGDPLSIYYLTGIHITPYERFYGLVVDSVEKNFKMIIPSVDKGAMKDLIPELVYIDDDGPGQVIKEAISGCKSLAIDEKYYSISVGKYFLNDNCKFTDVGPYISKLRMYKDELEIKNIKQATKIVDEAIAYVKDKIKPGMKEKDLHMMLFTFMSKYPGFITDETIIYVQGGHRSADPHAATSDYEFKYGDIVLMDFCAYYNYYWSDITRCLFIGEIKEPKLKEIYDIVVNANLRAIKAVKPGVKAKDIDKVARDYITEAGYGEYFVHRTGHGLGMSVHEEPYITGVNELILEEGMTFTIEPGIYLPGIGGVRIEDDILVTENGCEVLTSYSKKLEDNIIHID